VCWVGGGGAGKGKLTAVRNMSARKRTLRHKQVLSRRIAPEWPGGILKGDAPNVPSMKRGGIFEKGGKKVIGDTEDLEDTFVTVPKL